jgi:S1-C subfamily serine protease
MPEIRIRKSFVAPVLGMLLAAVVGGIVAAGAVLLLDEDSSAPAASTVTTVTTGATRPTSGNAISQLYERAAPAVVEIQAGNASGTGFVIDNEGRVVTNQHVVGDNETVEVSFADDQEEQGRVIGTDPSTDLAVIEVDLSGHNVTPVTLGSSGDVEVGDPVYAIGNPFGLERSITAGIVSALDRDITAPNDFTINGVIQTDAPVNRGNSGGPLLNANGEVIGVNSQIESETGGNVGIGFAVPVNTVREVVAQIKKTGKVEHAWLGIEMQEITEELADTINLPVQEGVMVVGVVEGSPADDAGLEGGNEQVIVGGRSYVFGGDIITHADGQAVTSHDDLRTMIMEKDPGDSISLEIQREDSQRTVNVTLGQQPAQPGG